MEKPIIAVLGGHHSAGHDQYDCVDHVYCERIVEAGALPVRLTAHLIVIGSPRCAWRRVWGCRCLAFVAAHS